MDSRPIGVFDSGLGGLSAVRHLRDLLPGENIIYFGDTGRVPYGTRSRDTIRRYAAEDCKLLLERDVKYIIAACGTVSSVAPDLLAALPVPAIGVVEPTAKAAAAATLNGRIGILGTAATFCAALTMRKLRHIRIHGYPLLSMLMPALWNGLLVGFELTVYIGGSFPLAF